MASVRDTRPKPRLFKSLGSFDELLEGPRQPVELPEPRLNKTAALATLQSLPRAISDTGGMLPLSSVKNIYVSLPVTKADLATTTAIRVPPIGQRPVFARYVMTPRREGSTWSGPGSPGRCD
jgi:hypothetical protein